MSDDFELDPTRDVIVANDEKELEKDTRNIIRQIQTNDSVWGQSKKGEMAKNIAMAGLATKNGMYAKVPLVCKGECCPYANQCQLLPYGMAPEGEFCAVELAQIEMRSMGYSQDIDYESASWTDKNLMSELVTLDVLLERCKALLAKEGTPIIDIAIGIDQEGNEIRQPVVSKAWEAYEKISKKRDATYQLLMMTRKDRQKDGASDEAKTVSDAFKDIIEDVEIE